MATEVLEFRLSVVTEAVYHKCIENGNGDSRYLNRLVESLRVTELQTGVTAI